MVITDFTRLPEQIIVDLINYDNGTTLTINELTFGTPTAIVGINNTKILATATAASYHTGSVMLSYNRVDLNTIPNYSGIILEATGAKTISDLIPAINSKYHLNLTVNDYIDEQLPPSVDYDSDGDNDGIQTFKLVASPKSLIFNNFVTLCVINNSFDIFDSENILHTLLNITLPSAGYFNLI